MLSIITQRSCFSLLAFIVTTSFLLADGIEDPHKVVTPKIEVCFVLDTTGSMSSLIQGAKDKIWSIANEIVNTQPAPQIKFALIGYRDRGDQYVTQVTDLTDDLDDVHSKLMAFSADGGGDTPESVNQALHESVTKISWSKDDPKVLKIVFLVGDAPPHMDYKDEIQYPEICQLAVKNDLIVNTIQCGSNSNTTTAWNDIARKSEGSFAAIQQNGGTVAIATPFDAEIAKCNTLINGTVCGYGDATVQNDVGLKLAANSSSKLEAIADRADFMSKSRRSSAGRGFAGRFKAVGGGNDLVELLIDGKVEFEAIDEAKLPGSLKNLNEKELEIELQKRIDDRKQNQIRIDELVKKRSEFIAKEKARMAKEGNKDGFDSMVKDMIQTQAQKKGIYYPGK